MSPAGLAAKCRRYGAWEPHGKLYHSWNADLLDPVIKDLSNPWQDFDTEVMGCNEKLATKLEALLDGVREELRGIDPS